MASMPGIDVVITTTVRRGASLTARAKKYDHLLNCNLKPDDINAIPEDIFNEMALACEPKDEPAAAGPEVDEDLVKSLIDEGVVTNQSEFEAAFVKLLHKHLALEIRLHGRDFLTRGLR